MDSWSINHMGATQRQHVLPEAPWSGPAEPAFGQPLVPPPSPQPQEPMTAPGSTMGPVTLGQRVQSGLALGILGGAVGGVAMLSMRYPVYGFEPWTAITPKVIAIGAVIGAAVGLVAGFGRAEGDGRSDAVATTTASAPAGAQPTSFQPFS